MLKSHFKFSLFPAAREGEKSTHMPAVLTTHTNFVPGCLDNSNAWQTCSALKVKWDQILQNITSFQITAARLDFTVKNTLYF